MVIEKILDLANKGYEEIKPAVKKTSDILVTVLSFFDDVVLYPIKKLSITFEEKAEMFKKDIESKYNLIPEQNRQEAPITILGPTIEALKYNIDEEELKEMFSNLLINSMDDRTASKCHPAYVEIIKQMNNNDAKLLKSISKKRGYQALIMPSFKTKAIYQDKIQNINIYHEMLPRHYIGISVDGLNVNLISKCLDNLHRLGLIDINDEQEINNGISIIKLDDLYEKLEKSEELVALINEYNNKVTKLINGINTIRGNYIITDFGKDFIDTCL